MEPAPPHGAAVAHVVMLDDDAELRVLIADYLEQHEFRVTTAASGDEARRVIARDRAAAIILDVMMPREDGLSVLRSLADLPGAPAVIMLSALGTDTDRIVGLELGADDYLTKPVNPRELLARLRAVLRRHAAETVGEVLTRAGWRCDSGAYRLTAPDGSAVPLTTGEFRLALALARNAGRVVTRDTLLAAMHGEQGVDPFDRAIDVAISRLRTKLAHYGGADLVRTVRGEGYLFGVNA